MSELGSAFLENRDVLLRFLVARGAGDAAEDLLQELWIKIQSSPPGKVDAPRSYLIRAANYLMIDRYRSITKATKRDQAWLETSSVDLPHHSQFATQHSGFEAREQLAIVEETLAELGARPSAVFKRHRVDGVRQRTIAEEMGISLSTVEADLRRCYAALAALRKQLDEV